MATRRARRPPADENAADTSSKAALQRQMEVTRDSLAETVKEIKDTVSDQYESVKETVSGVANFREQFQNEPLVWSLGALSAGFALGYTTGYARKEMQSSGRHSEVSAFANSMIQEVSTVGKTLVMPTLNVRIKELFGVDFSDFLSQINAANGSDSKPSSKRARKKTSKRGVTKRKRKAKQNGK
jgi:hypothetical protein